MKTKAVIFFTLFISLINLRLLAQGTPYLERVITISFQEERLDAALKRVATQGGFTFSYSPAALQTDRMVSFNFVNKTVREILDQFFSGTVQYKARGKYVILTRAQTSSRQSQTFSGYIVDESTGQRMRDVTVYDPVTLSSTVTDQFGFFQIRIDHPPEDLKLRINKQNYSDTIITVPSRTGRLLSVSMKGSKEKMSVLADSVHQKFKRFWQKTKLFTKGRINEANISDTIHRKTQISFLPFIGTNHALSGTVINDYSFNVLGGYSMGVRKLEIGSIFNIVRGDVHGVQLAGNFNAIGGETRGVQLAGIFNANRGPVSGAQLAGIFNFHWREVEDFAGAGILNVNMKGSDAVELAGIANATIGDQTLPHAAGILNFATGNARSQVAGVFNFSAKRVRGWQGGGVFNFAAKDVTGAQTAGVFNFSGKTVHGAQIAGVLNFAKKVKGVQFGLINVSDSVGGVPIGLLSVVMKGYHKFEVSADEIFYTNFAFRTGVRQFYNIIMAGAKPASFNDTSTHWTFGYGVGTAPRISKKTFLNLDITSQQIVQGGSIESVNMLNKVYLGLDYQFAKKMSLTFGATLNGWLTDMNHEATRWTLFSDIKPNVFYDKSVGDHNNLKMWVGGKIGLRFL